MEGAEIGLVLAHAAELRLKITDCIRRGGAEKLAKSERDEEEEGGEGEEEEEEEEGGDKEQETLLAICDALKSLEDQLAQLQDLQQQQRYERETILSQIDRSRRVLLSKLREYKGQEFEIINEAAAFAGETFDPEEWALFSPHPFSNDTYTSSLSKVFPNAKTKEAVNELAKCPDSKGKLGIWSFVGWVFKTTFTLVGVVAAARVAGYKPVLLKDGLEFEVGSLQCPHDKVLVVENGMTRCVAKRRVTAPFVSGVKEPNSLYGLG